MTPLTGSSHMAVELSALRDELRSLREQLQEELNGARENASSIAVKLGVDCEEMSDAAMWHASVQAIKRAQEVNRNLLAGCKASLNMVDGNGAPPDWNWLRNIVKNAEATK